MIVLSVD